MKITLASVYRDYVETKTCNNNIRVLKPMTNYI